MEPPENSSPYGDLQPLLFEEQLFPKFDFNAHFSQHNAVSSNVEELAAKAFSSLESKIYDYRACFHQVCFRPLILQAREAVQAHKSNPSQGFALQKIAVEALGKSTSMEIYFRFHKQLKEEQIWKSYEQQIERNSSLSKEDIQSKKVRLSQLRSEFCPPDACHFAHYSPQALIRACELLAEMETMMISAMRLLSGKPTSPRKDARLPLEHHCVRHLESISEILGQEKAKILRALQIRFQIISATKNLAEGDYIHFVVDQLALLGVSSKIIRYTAFEQTEEQLNTLFSWYHRFADEKTHDPLKFFQVNSIHHPLFVENFCTFKHPQGSITCLQRDTHKITAFQNLSGFRGSSPAVLVRYSLLLQALPDSCTNPSSCESWTAFIELVVQELRGLPKGDLAFSTSENHLIWSWERWWKFVGLTCLKKARHLLVTQETDIGDSHAFSLEKFRLIATLNQAAMCLKILELEVPQAQIVEQWCEREENFYNQCVDLAIGNMSRIALACSAHSRDKVQDIRSFSTFTAKIHHVAQHNSSRSNWEILKNTLEFRMLPPSSSIIWEFFVSLKRPAHKLSVAHDFLRILIEEIKNFEDPLLSLVQEIDAKIKHEASMMSPPVSLNSVYSMWLERIERQIEQSAGYLLNALAIPIEPDKNRIEAFFQTLLHLPAHKRLFNDAVRAFVKNTYRPHLEQNILLAHALTPIEESLPLEDFLEAFLLSNPSLDSLLATLSILKPLLQRFQIGKVIIKKWLLKQIKNLAFPNYLVDDKLLSIVEMTCYESQEEIFYAIDVKCIQKLKEFIQPSTERIVSVSSVRSFLSNLKNYSFPATERGRKDYQAVLAYYHPLPWHPLVWEFLRVWGPQEVAQEWRLAWLNRYTTHNEKTSSPKEMLAWEGNEKGYFRLRQLFGSELLPSAIQILTEYCKKVPRIEVAHQLLWQELEAFLFIDSTPSLETRDNLILKNYWDLVARFQKTILPAIHQGSHLSTFIQQRNWDACLELIRTAVTSNQDIVLRNLFWHLENGLAKQFIETKEVDRVPELLEMNADFKRKIIESIADMAAVPDIRPILVAFCEKMNQICNNIQPLHKFYRAFSSNPFHDWMLNFEEGDWSRMFPLLNERMLYACLNAFNQQLAVCITTASRFAWLEALNMLQGSHSNIREGLEKIEKAVIATRRVSDSLQLQQAVDLQAFPTKKWRQMLHFFLPKGGEVTSFSLTRGSCELHPLLQETLKPNGECAIEKQVEHSHPVRRIQTENADVFFKWEPCAFGLQFLDHVLFEHILNGHTPFIDFIKIKNSPGFFQLSETIPGISLMNLLMDRAAPVPIIDRLSYSKNFVRLFFDCEWDGKSSNYQATPTNAEGCYTLTMVDNELVFNRPYVFRRGTTLEILMTSILLCFDQIHEPLHLEVIKKIQDLDIYAVLKEVLIVCKQARRRMISCVEEKEESHAWERSDARYLGIGLQQRYLEHWYTILWRLKQLLKIHETPTHFQLLQALYPPIARQVRQAHRVVKHPETRFEYLYKQKYKEVSIFQDGKPRKTLLTKHSKQVLETCLSDQERPTFNPSNSVSLGIDAALLLIKELDQQSQEISKIRNQILQGEFASFLDLRLQFFKEQVLWGIAAEDRIKWPAVRVADQKELLNSIARCSFEYLYLSDCEGLTPEVFESLIKNSPDLQILDLSGIAFLTAKDIVLITAHCPSLKTLNISRTPLIGLSIESNSLTQLVANDCSFRSLEVVAPKLKLISLNNCCKLAKIDLFPHTSCRIESSGCSLEAAVKMKLVRSYAYVQKQSKPHQWSGEFTASSLGDDNETVYNICVAMGMSKQIEAFLGTSEKWVEGKNKRNPLHVAVSAKNDELIALLSLHKEFPYHCDNQNCTPLMQAATEGYLPAVKTLMYSGQACLPNASLSTIVVSIGSRVRASSTSSPFQHTLNEWNIGLNALICAAKNNQVAVIEFILPNLDAYRTHVNFDFGVNTRNYEGCTALGEAIKLGHLAAMKALLNAGASVSEENVLLAAKAGHIHVMIELALRNVRFSSEVIAHLSTKWVQLQKASDPLAYEFESFLTQQYQI